MPTFSSINLYKPLRERLEREDDDSFPPIKTPDALLTRDAKHVARFLSFPLPQVYHLRACVADAILSEPFMKTKSGCCCWDLLQKYHVDSSSLQQTSLSTGSRALDEMFCGRNIIQVSGPSPSGKTQLALSIAVHSTSTTSDVDSIVYYWTSSYSSFPLVRRLQQICCNHLGNRDDALHKIHFQSIHNGHQLHASIQCLLSSPKSHYVLILDSASAIFSNHSLYNNKDQDIIYQCCISLRKLAHTKRVKIFITNGTVQSGEKIALANTKWNPADIDLMLNCCTDVSTSSMRIINVSYVSSDVPHNGEAQVTLGINSSGIVDLPHPSI